MIDLSSLGGRPVLRPPPRAYTSRPSTETRRKKHSTDSAKNAYSGRRSQHTDDDASLYLPDDHDLFGDTVPLARDNLVELRRAQARAAHARAAEQAATTPPRGQALRRNLLMACILLGFFFSLLDTTIVSTSLLATSEDLDGFSDSSWVVLSYLLTYMGFSIFFAKLSDIYGRRNILVVSWIIFVISSVACGCSYDMTQLIICRAFQGVGGAGLYSLTTITLPEIGPADKPDFIGKIIGFTLSLSFVLGPVLGGVIPQIASWRVIYWLNGPFAIIAIMGIVFLYPVEYTRRHGTGRTLRRVDLIGSVLLLASTVLLVIAMQEGGSRAVGWNSLLVLVSLTSAAIAFALFLGWEYLLSSGTYWDMEAVFPLRLLKNRVYACCLVDKFLVGYVYLCLVITVPQRFQIVNGESVFKTGLHLLPMLGGTALGCTLAGPLNVKKNRTAPMLVVACALMVVSVGLLASVTSVNTPAGQLYAFLAVFGMGFGLFMSAGTMLSTAQAPVGDHAVAQGAISQLRILGGIIGLSTFTIVFNAQVQGAGVLGQLAPAQAAMLRRSPTALVELWPELQGVLRETFSRAFHTMSAILAGVSGLALAVSVGTLEKNPPPIHHHLYKEKTLSSTRRSSSGNMELDDTASDRSLVGGGGQGGGQQRRQGTTSRPGTSDAERGEAAASGGVTMAAAMQPPVPTLFPPPRSHVPDGPGRGGRWR